MIRPRRAFVGFSSPVGYSYAYPASKTRSDNRSSPNPVLMGAMGLFVLYDEIWFACESLCPESMRRLPYVRFLDVRRPKLFLKSDVSLESLDDAQFPGDADLNDLFPGGYEEMPNFFGPDGSVDNHTHELDLRTATFNGNPGRRQLAFDAWLLAQASDLGLELILNPVTAKIAFGGPSGQQPIPSDSYEELRLAEAIVSLRNLYDLTGPSGPHHDCVERIRTDGLVRDFRGWLAGERNRLSNQQLSELQADVDARVLDLQIEAFGTHADRYSFKNVAVDLVKNTLGGLGAPWAVIEAAGRLPERSEVRAFSFIGRTHTRQHQAFGVHPRGPNYLR